MKGVDRLVWPKQFPLLAGRRISLARLVRAISADEELSTGARRALRPKRLESVLAKSRGAVTVTRELARSVMKLNDDDLYGVSSALGIEGIDANRLDIDDMAVALLYVCVGAPSLR